MIQAIIFDCFGVLAEDGWLPFKRQYIGDNTALAQEVADLGKQNEYGMLDTNTYFAQVAGRIGVEEQVLRNAVGKQAPNKELLSYIEQHLKPQYKIGLLSNANYDVVSDLFTSEQAAIFDAAVLSYQTRLVKPDPRMFELIASKLDVVLSDCVFIDDVERYCTAAEILGMQTIVYESPKQCIAELETILTETS